MTSESNGSLEKTATIQSVAVKSKKPWRQFEIPISALATHDWPGKGTTESPYIVDWLPDDPENPMTWNATYKWFLVVVVGIATLAVAFDSSAFAGGVPQLIGDFGASTELATAGVSLFVLGFAVGPLLWAPLSEVLGRRILFIGTYGALTVFIAGICGAQNMKTVLVLRFFAGAFGSSPLTNAGGTIADVFSASQRGLALSIFSLAPFLGPSLGPIVGGFTGQAVGWRWVQGVMAIFTGVVWIVGSLAIPETYPPVLLRQRANALHKYSGLIYRSKFEEKELLSMPKLFKTALSRPWVLLFREPIVLLLSIYMAIIYGTLYMMFAAFPIVYQEKRGWNQGVGGLPFLGIMIGMIAAAAYSIPDNARYLRVAKQHEGRAPPEARLPPGMVGCVFLPIGLFWFAWTNSPSVFWLVSVIATVPFGFGMVLVFLCVMNYLIDSYTIYAASVLAANSVLRSLFGAAFPLFTTYMYNNLGIHWASSIPAFLALACVPFLFIFYRYGARVRMSCKYAREADEVVTMMMAAESAKGQTANEGIGILEGEQDEEQVEATRIWTGQSMA